MKPNIGITEKDLKNASSMLAIILASEMTLYVKTRKAHWNVTGESFMELHELFECQYKQTEEAIDEVAERIGKLGEKTIGTMEEFSKLSIIKESPGTYALSTDLLQELLSDHEMIIVQIRKDIEGYTVNSKDFGTTDFLTGLMEQHETTAWILRRYLN
jgi:starvation-inducible DNA-binding protein